MGYYTWYTFKAPESFMQRYSGPPPELEPHLQVLEEQGYEVERKAQKLTERAILTPEGDVELDGYGFYYDDRQECFEIHDSGKFYTYADVFKELSREFEGVWVVEGRGEESGDVWKHYFKGGKSFKATARLVFEPYDESKLS